MITPQFNETILNGNGLEQPETFLNHLQQLAKAGGPVGHSEVLKLLIEQIEKLSFEEIAFPELPKLKSRLEELTNDKESWGGEENTGKRDNPLQVERKRLERKIDRMRLNERHILIISIEHLLSTAKAKRWGLCRSMDFIYLYNGAYWKEIEKGELEKFLGEAAEKMGVEHYKAAFFLFKDKLCKQFLTTAYLPTPAKEKDTVLINLKNGTFEITASGVQLRGFNPADFLTYQLPFEYDEKANAPLFQAYLDRVLPDIDKQKVLAEFLGYVFTPMGTLKLEKTLLCYGSGANGKSVLFEIVNAMLGADNVSSYSLQSLTNESGYQRAKLANILVNYTSEINGSLETAIFKQLVSGEPVEARLPYGQPFTLTQYARLIFNCNELPKDVEHTEAYFRRFLIIPFDITIPEGERDPELSKKIIETELSGVFNWVLDGLQRLLQQKKFTNCEAIRRQLEAYKLQSDSVRLFLEDAGYKPSANGFKLIKELYQDYRLFCNDDGCNPVKKTNFKKRLESAGINTDKINIGNVAYLEKPNFQF
jgi:putative DNA primase/helicase